MFNFSFLLVQFLLFFADFVCLFVRFVGVCLLFLAGFACLFARFVEVSSILFLG